MDVVRTLGAFNRFKSFVLTQPPQHLAQDIRASCGRQGFVADAPVNFVYVADFSKMGAMGDDDKILYSAAATGFVIQNVYLFCSANGLATVVRGSIDRPTLVRKMNLQNDQRIILARTIGYPG